ncbi:hypothetical protein [Spiroplasma endosymbiont of Aspidapion aeneum]|uniref:glycoside hydrolase family 38 N-terminal domain-containing protein n=1 Tax=Spiroplasma endosymbiont of Aspidapion aeneum TaxID=3066276 RepID=UPI00313C8B68
MKKWKIYVVPHTHWDREWYFTKATANTFMYINIEKIYNEYILKKDKFPKFVFDSQYSIIDDYLKYSPKSEEKIKNIIKDDKLVVSPWYTQTDTFNVTGESIVRNMLTGTKESEKYGNMMNIAYMPDSFGFNSNLPQIFNQFKMKAFIHWRGVKKEQLHKGVLNKWTGIDGSSILSYNLFKYGYTCGGRFLYDLFVNGYEKDNIKENALKIYEAISNDTKMHLLDELKEASKNTNNKILFPWGSDQIVCFENLENIIEEINKLDSENEWILTSYEEFIDEIVAEIKLYSLESLVGELRYGEFSRAHKTINSSRYDIKYLTKNLEYLIYKITEPLSLIYEKMGGTYYHELIQYSQKILFECQAHDSVGGCNSDVTNLSIIERINSATDNLLSLITYIHRQIANVNKNKDNDILVFNLEPFKRTLNTKMKIFTKFKHFEIVDSNNKKVKFEILDQDYVNADEFKTYNHTHLKKYNISNNNESFYTTNILLKFENSSPMSINILQLKEIKKSPVRYMNSNFIENEYFKIILENNNITLFDKIRNISFNDFFNLEANIDAGDLYDYSPDTMQERVISNYISASIIQTTSNTYPIICFEMKYNIDVKNKLNNNAEQKFNVRITLIEDNIDLDINVINTCKNIRWRIIFNTNISSSYSYNDTSFGKTKHKIGYEEEIKIWKKREWNDYPIDIEALESCCWLKNDKYNYAIFARANNEYQVVGNDKSKLALTMYRCVSYIGNNNLLYRPNRASGNSVFPLATPTGNLEKELNFNFRVHITKDEDSIVSKSKQWCIFETYYQIQNINRFYKNGDMFVLPTQNIKKYNNDLLDINIDKDLVISCLKKSYDQKEKVFRIYNPTSREINIESLSKFSQMFANEKKMQIINKVIKPNQFITFSF